MNEQDRLTRSAVAGERQTEIAVLAGGCFWGVEEILRKVPGVLDTDVGYTGGWLENPTYHDTHDSKSGHADGAAPARGGDRGARARARALRRARRRSGARHSRIQWHV